MKVYKVKLKQENMLCRKCLLNVVKALSNLSGIKELDVNLENKSIKIAYDNESLSRQTVQNIVNESIIKGKVNKALYE